jgi:UDPglucose 6-dehydrogenase
MQIAVIGTGYVGLVTGACFAEFGTSVTCVDVDAEKIARLNDGQIPIYEPGPRPDRLEEQGRGPTQLHDRHQGAAVEQSLVIFLAVGTPPKEDGSADLSYIEGRRATWPAT